MYGSNGFGHPNYYAMNPDFAYYQNLSSGQAPPPFNSQGAYNARPPPQTGPLDRRPEPAHSQPAPSGLRPASQAVQGWLNSNFAHDRGSSPTRYPRYQPSNSNARTSTTASSNAPSSSSHRFFPVTGPPSGSSAHRTQSSSRDRVTAPTPAPTSRVSPALDSDDLTKKKKEIEQQEKILSEIAADRAKLDRKEQETRLKIANLRSEITVLARQQQQREESQRQERQQRIETRNQRQETRQQNVATRNASQATFAPPAQYHPDPRRFVDAIRTAPSSLPYHSVANPAPLGAIVFGKLNLRFNVIATADFLKSTIFIPKQATKLNFTVPAKPGVEKVLLRICSFERFRKEQTDHISCRLHVFVNCNLVFGGKKVPLRGPLDITAKVVPGPNCIEIKEGIPPAGAVADPLPQECAVTIVKAYKLETKATLNMLETDAKYCRPQDETLKLIKSQFIISDTFNVTEVKVSLTCPLTKKRLELPCFGANCKHLYFFDGKSFVEMNQNRDEWCCPHCKMNIGMDELRVDGLIRKIMSECKPSATQIEFDKDGNWRPVEEAPAVCKSDRVREANADKDEDIIVLGDSDDEPATGGMNQVPRGETTERTTPPDDDGDSNDSDVIARRRMQRKRLHASDDSDETPPDSDDSDEDEEQEEGETSSSDSNDSSRHSSSSEEHFSKSKNKSSSKKRPKSRQETVPARKPGPKSRTAPQTRKK